MKILLGNIKEILSTEELNQLEKIEGDVAVHLNAIPIRVAGILDEAFAYVGRREYLHRGDGTTIVRYIRHGRKFERKIKFHSKGQQCTKVTHLYCAKAVGKLNKEEISKRQNLSCTILCVIYVIGVIAACL